MRNFENPQEGFGRVSADGFARILARVSDVAFLLDGSDGTVRDVAFGSGHLADAGLGAMIGRPIAALVTSESLEKIAALLAGDSADGRWRQVNFVVADGEDVPISLQMFGLGGGRMLAVGRDERQSAIVQRRFIAAQRELQQSHARQRQADLRFQTLLALTDLAVVTLDADTFRIIDLNPAAALNLGEQVRTLVGQAFTATLATGDLGAVQVMLTRVRETGRIASFSSRLRNGEERRFEAAMFRFEDVGRIIVRVVDADARRSSETMATDFVARLPHAIAITDENLRLLHVNRAFVDLAELSIEENALGQPLDRFIGRNGVDTDILLAALRDQPMVRDFASVMSGAFRATQAIDLDAVRLGDDSAQGERRYAFLIRPVQEGVRRTRALDAGDRVGLAEQMTDVVGRVSLKEIVRETTDVIERLCIETALGMTENNRAAASDMLGISRQSLYAKLARYGIGGDPDAT